MDAAAVTLERTDALADRVDAPAKMRAPPPVPKTSAPLHPRPQGDAGAKRARLLTTEKKVILAFRFVVALSAAGFVFNGQPGMVLPWQFYLVMAVFVLSNVVFFFEKEGTFDTRRAQLYIFAFDVGILTILMIFLGLSNKEFYLVFFLTIFISALSKKMSYAFAISAVMSGLYVVFAVHGRADVELTSATFLTRVVLFFVVSSFVGHISEVAEASRRNVDRLADLNSRIQDLALEQDKMAAVGVLAAGVAHEFNNFIAGIQGYADLARMDAVELDEFAEVVAEQCKRAAGIVRDLLSFSRNRGCEPELVDVSAAVDQVLRLVRKELAATSVEVDTRLAPRAPVMVEPGSVERVVLNLVLNAVDALEKDGRLAIEVTDAGPSVVLRVIDNGRGMGPEELAHAFEPFHSSRPDEALSTARASGLGLAVSKRLIERTGGSIGIESELGRGTTVTVTLPKADLDPARDAVRTMVTAGGADR